MEQFKRAKVVMLPTDKTNNPIIMEGVVPNNITLTKDVLNDTTDWMRFGKPNHLYIISNDEIKEGDWFIDITLNNYGELYKSVGYSTNKGYENWIKSSKGIIKEPYTQCKKIIATTDTSLIIPHGGDFGNNIKKYLPQPSQQFIEKYIEEYNKDNVIKDVLVEYNHILEIPNNVFWGENLKINTKDNTITIKKLKDSWNREEVISLLLELVKDCGSDEMLYSHYSGEYRNLNKWIEENL